MRDMPLYFRHLALVLLLCNSSVADWPQFRGPTGGGVSDAKNVPVHWSATESVAWRKSIRGSGWSSPVLSGNRLYVTTAISEVNPGAVSLHALCLDAIDGRTVWDAEVLRPEPADSKVVHTKNSLASPTPCVYDARLYVHFGHLGTAALDLNGNILWRQTNVTYSPVHGNGGSPALVDGMLVFSCDGGDDPFVIALNQGTGDVRWKASRNTSAKQKFSFSTPTIIDVDGEQQIVSAGSGFVGAYAPQDGREIWRVTYGEGYSVVPRPVFAHGLVFIASGFNRAQLLAIDPKNARGDVTDTHVIWSHDKGVPLTPSVVVAGDELYFVSDNGVASCLDARAGNVHWSKRLAGDFSASPVAAEGRIYFQNESGVTFVVEANKKFELLATNDLAERTLASPAPADNAIFVRSESHLWRIGERIWQAQPIKRTR